MLSRKKFLNSGLLIVAALIWGWNARLLTGASTSEPEDLAAIPEIPQNWEHLFAAEELPEMKFDPFNPFGKVNLEDINTNKPRSTPEAPPRGQVILILDRGEHFEAVFKGARGKTITILENHRIDRWMVEKIELDRVLLRHQASGKTHEFTLP